MTPKLKLSDAERKVLLSWILKLCFPGMRWIIKSTHIIMAPAMQAMNLLTYASEHTSIYTLTNTAHTGHDPSSGIIVETHIGDFPCGCSAIEPVRKASCAGGGVFGDLFDDL